MKNLFILLLFVPIFVFAQKRDCKFKKTTNPGSGKDAKAIVTPIPLGELTVGISKEKYFFGCSMKNITPTADQAWLQLDSITFVFSDNSTQTLAARGIGIASNDPKVKVILTYLTFSCEIPHDLLTLFQSKRITSFAVSGEKDSQGGSVLKEKQGEKLNDSFNCLE